MGLVLAAPADLLAPLVETPQAAPAEAVPEDGLFASLLASLSAMADGEITESVVPTIEIPDAPAVDEDSKENSDTNPFAALMAMSVALPVVQPATEQAHRDWTVTQGDDHVAGVHERASGIEVNYELSEEITMAMAAKPMASAEAGTPIPTEAAVPETAVPETAAQPVTAAAAPHAMATEAATSSLQAQVQRPSTENAVEAKPAETAHVAEASSTNETPGVVRSVGNAESNATHSESDNGNGRDGKESAARAIPRASAQGILHASDASAVAQLQTPETAPVDAVVPMPTDSAGATETPPQVEQVAQTVIDSVEAGRGEARIHLDPAGLGEVTIHVRTDHDHVRVEIRAERQEAMQLLRDHTQDLSNLLGQRGLNLSDVNVGLGRGNGDQLWGREEKKNGPSSGNEFASILGIDEPTALDTHNRLRAAYNPDGALVYRV